MLAASLYKTCFLQDDHLLWGMRTHDDIILDDHFSSLLVQVVRPTVHTHMMGSQIKSKKLPPPPVWLPCQPVLRLTETGDRVELPHSVPVPTATTAAAAGGGGEEEELPGFSCRWKQLRVDVFNYNNIPRILRHYGPDITDNNTQSDGGCDCDWLCWHGALLYTQYHKVLQS